LWCTDDEKVVGMTAAYPPLLAESLAGPEAEWRLRTFAGVAAQVPEARAFVAGALAGCPAREDLMLCVTELCANAIEHAASGAGGGFTVEVARPADGVAYVAVTGAGDGDWAAPDPDAARATANDLAEGGRGLALVAACSSRWGYEKASGPMARCTVWAEATWPVPVGTRYVAKQGIRHDIGTLAAAEGGAA
jgi:anti-sigma regulatory factor (Ser/Thr protein kinase)